LYFSSKLILNFNTTTAWHITNCTVDQNTSSLYRYYRQHSSHQ